jgi:ankyrin repeat protein
MHKGGPLQAARRLRLRQVVNALLDAGADPGALDTNGRTPLDEAEAGGHSEIVRALQAARAERDLAAQGAPAPEAARPVELSGAPGQPPAALGGGGGGRRARGSLGPPPAAFGRCARLASAPRQRPAALLAKRPVACLVKPPVLRAGLAAWAARLQVPRPVPL